MAAYWRWPKYVSGRLCETGPKTLVSNETHMPQVHKKASLRVIVKFHHLKTVGCGLVPVTVLPLQNAEALYVGLGLHQIPFAILRPQRSLKTVGPMKETYFIARSVDIEAHTNAAIAQAATFCNLSQISEINNRMGVNHTYMYKLYINPKIPLYFILFYNSL